MPPNKKPVKVQDDTIVAIATPLGKGGIGVIRLSGPASVSLASQIFHSKKTTLVDAASHTVHYGWVGEKPDLIDEVLATPFRAPASYTGEDVVEFSCHGSPAVLKAILELCQKKGARLAGPGEFTQRAYLNGKVDLSQAEAVADLIQARSSSARRAAADQLKGELAGRLANIRQRLIDLLAHVEANLDFAEEDISGLPTTEIHKRL